MAEPDVTIAALLPALWWKLDDGASPVVDSGGVVDGAAFGTVDLASVGFLPASAATVLDTLGTGVVTSDADVPLTGDHWTVVVFWQLNDPGTEGGIIYHPAGQFGSLQFRKIADQFWTIADTGSQSLMFNQTVPGRFVDTDPHMWYFASNGPTGVEPTGTGTWGIDGIWTDFGPNILVGNANMPAGPLTVGGFEAGLGNADVLIAHVIIFDYYLDPADATAIYLAAGLPTPVQEVWTNVQIAFDVEVLADTTQPPAAATVDVFMDNFTVAIAADTSPPDEPDPDADIDVTMPNFAVAIAADMPGPANNHFADALPITPETPITGNVERATLETDELDPFGWLRSVWYTFTVADDPSATITITSSDPNMRAQLLSAASVDTIDPDEASWFATPAGGPQTRPVTPGVWHIRVAATAATADEFTLTVVVGNPVVVDIAMVDFTVAIVADAPQPFTDIELPSIDGASPPIGPADVELYDPGSLQDIELPSIDGASAPGGVTLDHFPIIEIPFLPVVTAKLHDRLGNLLSDLDNAYGITFQDPFNDVGTGSISMPFDDPEAALITASTEVRCYLYGELVYSWEVEQDPKVNPIDEGEESKQEVAATGPGRVSLFGRARVYPYKGVAGQLMGQHRLYTFASPDFPNIDGWGPAVQGLRQDEVDPVRHSTIEWTTVSSITDIPDAVDYIPAAAPLGWMVPTAYWIWGTADTLQVGFCYFRGSFTLTSPVTVMIAATADNLWTLYLDGNPIMGETGAETNWQERKEVRLDLPAGTYYLAAAVENVAWPGPAEFNPAGFLCAVYTVNTEDDTLQTTIYVTDSSWTVLAYPAIEPGWTPGQILIDAIGEAQSRGSLTDFTIGFSAFADSTGSPWIGSGGVVGSYVPGFSMPIGASILDMLNSLMDQGWLDYRMLPGGKVLQCFSQGNGNVNTGIDIQQTGDVATQNVVSVNYDPQGPPVTRLLVKWSEGFFELNDAGMQATYGDYEGYLTIDAPSEVEARRQAQRMFDDMIRPQTAIVIEIDPAAVIDRPYISYAVGDQLTIPDEDGVTPVDRKLLSITVDETDMGRPAIALEFGARVLQREREQFKLIQLLGRGVAGNGKVRSALNETTGLSHG